MGLQRTFVGFSSTDTFYYRLMLASETRDGHLLMAERENRKR